MSALVRPFPLLLLAALPLAAAAQEESATPRWRLRVMAEELRVGSYLDHEVREESFDAGYLFAQSRTTRVRLNPMRGARAELVRTAAASPWGMAVDLGWAHGPFTTEVATYMSGSWDGAPVTTASAERVMWGEAISFAAGAGVTRTLGNTASRLSGMLSIRPSVSLLDIPFVEDLATYAPTVRETPYGGYSYGFGMEPINVPEPRSHRYLTPAATLGVDASVTLLRGLSLELSARGTMLRSAGRALGEDLNDQPWGLSGPAPVAEGRNAWVPVSSVGVGLSWRQR